MLRRRLLKASSGENDFVDLGLSVKWAKGNICKGSRGNYYIGKPTDYGCYYSWGNIDGHNEGDGYNFNSSTYRSTPGSSLKASIASNDAAHDAALACLGTGRLPTRSEAEELLDNTSTTVTSSYNGSGIQGVIFKSKKIGYTNVELFIPFSGEFDGGSLKEKGNWNNMWTSTFWDGYPMGMFLDKYATTDLYRSTRYYGRPIRAVQPK